MHKKALDNFSGFSLSKKFLIILNILLSVMIISTSSILSKTEFGKMSVAFGFCMLAISTILIIIQKI